MLRGTPESREEKLTRQFYDWELWGRGWMLWEQTVSLEPPFEPFFGHCIAEASSTALDDGRKPTLLSSLFDRKRRRRSVAEVEDSEPRLPYLDETVALAEVQVVLPSDTKVSKDATVQLLLGLGHVSRPISFELVATNEAVEVQLACAQPDLRQLREQLAAYFPESQSQERHGYLSSLWNTAGNRPTVVVDFGLSKEFMRPLRCFDRFDPDPLAGLIGAMSDLSREEVALFQILFVPTINPWSESIIRSVTDSAGESFFADDDEMAKLAAQKIASPLFAAAVRVAAQSRKESRAFRLTQGIAKGFRKFADPASNELIPLSNDGYNEQHHSLDVVNRQSRRTGMFLNSDELVSFVHLPSASARSVKLKREDRKTKAAPGLAFGHRLLLGENYHAGKVTQVTLSQEQRARHVHLIGASGSGKSNLLLNMMVQDIRNGEGLAVLDPHGDLIEQLSGHIPEERVNDVILFDPADEEYPIGFNILTAHSDLEKNFLASDLVSVFRRLSTSFGDQMNTVLANAILAFLESSEGGTLADLRRFLVEAEFRQRFLETVQDPEIVYYWKKEFPLLTGKPQGPILTRLDTFLRPKVIRHMVSQKENRLDLRAIMDSRKILLIKLSQGLIGEENSYLLGTFLVSKLNQVATSRQNMAASERHPFYLYVDEFHNFITPSMAAILSGARKYNLGLILAHQEMHQLSSRDGEVASAVISNPYTRVCFRLGDADARKLEDGFSSFKAKDLQNLAVGEAIGRIERAEYDFNLKTSVLSPVEPVLAIKRREQILTHSRTLYAARREQVEAMLRVPRIAALDSEPAHDGGGRRARLSVVPTPPKLPPEQATERASDVSIPGRGGEHHKYLQQLIKRWAESRGYSVTVEKPILNGLGSVDVALEKDGRSIACEISVTTTSEHELANVQKCLASGFREVVLISSDRRVLTSARHALATGLSNAQYRQVKFLTPEETFSFIESLEAKVAPTITPSPDDLMTAKEVEELLRIDVKTVYSYVKRGLLPYVKIQSNVRFLRSAVLQWMEERQYKPERRPSRK